MKVCYVTHLPNLTGANRSLLDMLDGLDRRTVEPLVLLNGRGPVEEELKRRNVPYRIMFYSPATNSDNRLKDVVKRFMNSSALNRISVECMKRVLREEAVDLVHNNSFIVGAGMQAAKELRIPYICHIREFLWEDHHRKFFNSTRQYELLSGAAATVAVSSAVKDKFQKFTDNSIDVLYDAIKTEDYLLPLEKKFQRGKIYVLMAGRIAPGKGQLEAVKAVEKLYNSGRKNIRLIVIGGVGDDKYYHQLTQYLKRRNLKYIRVKSFVKDLRGLRQKCDIGLTCSKAEAYGRVTLENMLSSLLVIAGDSAGSKELVRDGETGLLYHSESYEDLADCMEKAICDPDNSNRIIAAGRAETMGKYDPLRYAEAVYDIYRKILGNA